MVIKSKPITGKIEIDLTGPQGNAFALLGVAKHLAEAIGRDPKPIMDEMKSGNYENLIANQSPVSTSVICRVSCQLVSAQSVVVETCSRRG